PGGAGGDGLADRGGVVAPGPTSRDDERLSELLQPGLDAAQGLLSERLGAVADALPGQGPVDRDGGGKGLGFDDLVAAAAVGAAGAVRWRVAAQVAAGDLEPLHGAHPRLAAGAPGARPEPLVPVRGAAQALVPVRHV